MKFSISSLLFCILFILLRAVLPVEFTFQKTVADTCVLPALYSFLYHPVFEFAFSKVYIYHLVLLVWGVGMIIFGTKSILDYVRFHRRLESSPHSTHKQIERVLEQIEAEHKKKVNFQILRTKLVLVPMIFGLFAPKIVLPDEKLSDKELYYILRHEIAHYRNHDLWIKLFVEAVCIFCWWNPLIYAIKGETDKLLEIRADLSATKSYTESERIEYLECLLKIAKANFSPQNSWVLTFDASTASVLADRFRIVLDYDSTPKAKEKNLLLIVFVIFSVMLASFFVVEPYSIDEETARNTVEITAENAKLVKNPIKGYDVYVNNQYFATIDEISESFLALPLYDSLQDTPFYEELPD